MFRTTFLISYIAAVAAAARPTGRILQKSPADGKIVGGADAAAGEFPNFGIDVPQRCGGALIWSDMVVTAADCDDLVVGDTFSIGGILRDGTDGRQLTVAQLIPHPNYNDDTNENDIMLLRLDAQTGITPAGWNDDEDLPAVGETVIAVGYGGTTTDGGSPSSTLLKVDVPVVSIGDCNSEMSYDGEVVGDLMLCAGEAGEWSKKHAVKSGCSRSLLTNNNKLLSSSTVPGKGSCEGDGGGPLYNTAGEIVGITSFGIGCGAAGFPGVYTRISAYDTFLKVGICANTGATVKPNYCAELATASPTATPPVPGTCLGGFSCQLYAVVKVIAIVIAAVIVVFAF